MASVEELRSLGNQKFRALNYGAALMYYTQALDKDVENFAIYYNRAVTLVKMDSIDEAKEDLINSLKYNPNYIPSLCQLAFVYLYQGNTPDSLETYIKIVKINENLPNQLNRFKAQLKESIRLAESRCKQQEYSQDFIDSIITPDLRQIIDSYPNLPTHMVESGIPPVAFGNVPISHGGNGTSAIIARASIPVPVATTATNTTNATNNNDTNANNNTNNTSTGIDFGNLLRSLGGQGVNASVNISGPQQGEELLNMFGLAPGSNNTGNTGNTDNTGSTDNTATTGNANNGVSVRRPAVTRTVIRGPITNNTNEALARHREVHENAVSRHREALERATELRQQREAANSPLNSVSAAPATTVTTDVNSDSINNANETSATAANPTSNTTVFTTTIDNNDNNTHNNNTNNGNAAPGSDFASNLARTIATQITNAAAQHIVGSDNTANNGAIQSLAQNISQMAGSVIGNLASGSTLNNFASATNHATANSGNTGSSNTGELDEDLDVDVD